MVESQKSLRTDTMGASTPEKIVNNYGQPDNCSRAVIRILQVVFDDFIILIPFCRLFSVKRRRR